MKKTHFMRIIYLGTSLAVIFFLYEYIKIKTMPNTAYSSIENKTNEVQVAEITEGKTYGVAQLGGHFKLTDSKGIIRTDADFKGRYMLVYFGYSYCPDICPAALNHLSTALNTLTAKERQQLSPLFITIDPKRDSKEHLASYMENFHQDIIALTGDERNVQEAIKAYHVYARKVIPEDSSENYLIDHSSIVYFMNRQGKYITSFNHETPPEDILNLIRSVLNS